MGTKKTDEPNPPMVPKISAIRDRIKKSKIEKLPVIIISSFK
jgi:hypothetical protein